MSISESVAKHTAYPADAASLEALESLSNDIVAAVSKEIDRLAEKLAIHERLLRDIRRENSDRCGKIVAEVLDVRRLLLKQEQDRQPPYDPANLPPPPGEFRPVKERGWISRFLWSDT